jgi:hypothetical protein
LNIRELTARIEALTDRNDEEVYFQGEGRGNGFIDLGQVPAIFGLLKPNLCKAPFANLLEYVRRKPRRLEHKTKFGTTDLPLPSVRPLR